MSVGHRLEAEELDQTSLADALASLGTSNTPYIFDDPFTLDTEHDWPAAGGMSVDRKRVILDRTIYQQIMDGAFNSTGLTPLQVIKGWVKHERSENAIIVGDNPIDWYFPAHKRALALEHEHYRDCGADPTQCEKAFWPLLVECYNRPIKHPPLDAWCGVYLDEPTEQDEEILQRLARLGVRDAQKTSKYDVHYGFAHHRCDHCSMWTPKVLSQPKFELADCTLVSGLVRADRGCERWMQRKGNQP